MRFDQHEWVNDIVTGAITGVACGAVGAMLVPNPPFVEAIVIGGIVGLVPGLITIPLRWLLNRRPRADQEEGKDHEQP